MVRKGKGAASSDEIHALVSKRRSFQYTKKFNDKPNDKTGQFSNQPEEKKHYYRFNNNCNYCGKPGHYAKDCRKKQWDRQQRQLNFSRHKSTIGEKGNALCVALKANVSNEDEWVRYYGATRH